MAKRQQIGTSSSLLSASAALAESKSSTPVLEAVSESFGAAIKMVEEEQQRIQDKVNDYMGDLKTDIDFTTLDPAMEKQVRSYLLEGKNEYSSLANELAKMNDASDPRYQEIVDKMSNIQKGYSNLAAELASYNQNKITTAEQIRNGEFSKGTDQLGRVSSIYGLDGTKPTMSIKDGHLSFNVNGETVDYYKMKNLPGVATKVADSILGTQVELSKRGTAMTPQEKNRFARTIEDSLRNQDTLASILSDYPDELPFDDLREQFFDLRQQGKLDAEALKEIRTQVKERILKGYDEASALGVRNAKDKKASSSTSLSAGSPNDKRFKTIGEIENTYTEMTAVQNAIIGGKDAPRYVSIPNKPNLQLRFVQKKDSNGEPIQNDPGYWVWMGRTGSTGDWKPLMQSDGSVDLIPNARDWYLNTTGGNGE